MLSFVHYVAPLEVWFVCIPWLVPVILLFPFGHISLDEPITLIHLFSNMYYDVVVWNSDIPLFEFFLDYSIFSKYAKRTVGCSQGMKISLFTAALSWFVILLILLLRWCIIVVGKMPSYPIYSSFNASRKVHLLLVISMFLCFQWPLSISYTLFFSFLLIAKVETMAAMELSYGPRSSGSSHMVLGFMMMVLYYDNPTMSLVVLT